MRQIQQKQHRW